MRRRSGRTGRPRTASSPWTDPWNPARPAAPCPSTACWRRRGGATSSPSCSTCAIRPTPREIPPAWWAMEPLPSMTVTEDPWTAERGGILLRIARQSLSEALGFGEGPRGWDDPWLREPGATFVTLRRSGNLRGCVGSIQAYRPLFDDVWLNPRASPFHDSRFPPVQPFELGEISMEVSLLS